MQGRTPPPSSSSGSGVGRVIGGRVSEGAFQSKSPSLMVQEAHCCCGVRPFGSSTPFLRYAPVLCCGVLLHHASRLHFRITNCSVHYLARTQMEKETRDVRILIFLIDVQ
ncbi:hypothetical protein E2C01_040929 [Portunus trituberculatus]|uniref:Uncharacterized protein n=1 Tax=Portunus trituberculatus TaxID=210409 RepID=A0A5B7FQ38_PORTR|nr:hypothetical protein [Portunus trituberculatus]